MMKHNRQMCQFHEIWLNAFASGGFIKSWLVYDTSLFSFEMYFYLLMLHFISNFDAVRDPRVELDGLCL